MRRVAKVTLDSVGGGIHLTTGAAITIAIRHINSRQTSVRLRAARWSMQIGTVSVREGVDDWSEYDAFNVLELLTCAVQAGDTFFIVCEGDESDEAVSALRRLFLESGRFAGSTFDEIHSVDEKGQ